MELGIIILILFHVLNCLYCCRDKGLESYIGPWALFEDIEWTEEKQIIIKGLNLKPHKQETNERWSKEELLLRYDECNSSIHSTN